MSTREAGFWAVLGCIVWSTACGGAASQYNFARSYEPLGAEKSHFKSAQAVPYEDVKRDPNGFQSTEIGWLGVVHGVSELEDGRTRLKLALHAHHERHLCSDQNASSCRMTIAERELGPFTVEVALKPEEKQGPDRVWVGSLLKIYGHPSGEYSDDGGPILKVDYYRHWPRAYYVSTASRASMRR